MKEVKFVVVICILISLFVSVWASLPADKEIVAEHYVQPGQKTFLAEVMDANGNYEGNFLRVKLLYTPPDGISAMILGGLSVWPDDPNFFVVDNAVYNPQSDDPNLYGSFTIKKVWKHQDYEIGIWVFDVADQNDCKYGYIYSRDKGRPKVDKFERYQK